MNVFEGWYNVSTTRASLHVNPLLGFPLVPLGHARISQAVRNCVIRIYRSSAVSIDHVDIYLLLGRRCCRLCSCITRDDQNNSFNMTTSH